VTQEKGTERPWSQSLEQKKPGAFNCVVCEAAIFDSSTKFESGCGWPAFYDVLDSNTVYLIRDKSHGMSRIEVVCSNCGSHLGHVFDDGQCFFLFILNDIDF
jgi:peptide-methionine (R)-S-oxide reductase